MNRSACICTVSVYTGPTCEGVAGLEPGVLRVCVAGRGAVPLQVLLQVPALGLVEAVEEQGVLLEVRLQTQVGVQGAGPADHQGPDEAWVEVLLLQPEGSTASANHRTVSELVEIYIEAIQQKLLSKAT